MQTLENVEFEGRLLKIFDTVIMMMTMTFWVVTLHRRAATYRRLDNVTKENTVDLTAVRTSGVGIKYLTGCNGSTCFYPQNKLMIWRNLVGLHEGEIVLSNRNERRPLRKWDHLRSVCRSPLKIYPKMKQSAIYCCAHRGERKKLKVIPKI
jgi:hypothetical protein